MPTHYDLIGNGEKLLKHNGVFLSADMSDYNNTGVSLSRYNYINYGNLGSGGYDTYMTYIVGYEDNFNPADNPVLASLPAGNVDLPSNKGFVSITYDEYRANSRTETNATAKVNTGTYYDLNSLAEHKPIDMSLSFLIGEPYTSGCWEIGQNSGSWNTYMGFCSMQFISGTSSSVKYNNNMWGIFNPGIKTYESGTYLKNIWYDNNVVVYPMTGRWSYTATDRYNEVTNDGFLKSNAFYFRNKRLVANKLVKNSAKLLLDLTNNNLYYCDMNNNNYRMIISGQVPSGVSLNNIKDRLWVKYNWDCENAWGGKSTCDYYIKNLNIDYLNCSLQDAIKYKPVQKQIYKDRITNWGNTKFTKGSPTVYLVPGDTTKYTNPEFVNPSSFSDSGFYVFKCEISGNTNIAGKSVQGRIAGNMFKDTIFDSNNGTPIYPCSFTIMDIDDVATHNRMYGINTNYASAAGNHTAALNSGFKYLSNADKNYNLTNKATYSFISDKIEASSNNNVKVKWIFYKAKKAVNGTTYTYAQQIDYCLYNDIVSSYVPRGYMRVGDGSYNDTLTNNDAYFEIVMLNNSNTSVNPSMEFKNMEFFHTSSYYDALNG